MNYNLEIIGKNIKKERLKLKYTQAQLGEKVFLTGKQISNYENEESAKKTIPPLDVLLKLCEVFDCELGYLLGEECYSVKTQKTTIVSKETGLNEKSINQIQKIMGFIPEDSLLDCEPETYNRIVNALFSASRFIDFIKEIKNLDDIYYEHYNIEEEYNNETIRIESCLDSMDSEKARFILEHYESDLCIDDSLSDDEIRIRDSLSESERKIICDLYEANEKYYIEQRDFEYKIKFQRFIIQETLSFLLNDLYSKEEKE